ncbi:protoheme IX farnesyltransferase [uncultured Maricaulis sp.]|uniref:protoheme IX farnesyltransferase n=1 Tax=uncultured Maricaulis sp. TaxID=174710 RepID=UPI0030D827F0|tara:strand:+ start:27083 stop:27304 length:222 start_codon:yes stop_codon:yes gene_type:complete
MTSQDDNEAEHIPFGGREGRVVPGESVVLTPEQLAARKRRNIAIGLSLFAFCALVFVVSVVRIGHNFAQAGSL